MASTDIISLDQARTRLSQIWLAGCGIIFLILLVQSFGSVYRDQLSEVWGWAMPTMLPTLSLMISVLGADALIAKETRGKKTPPPFVVRRTFYTLVLWLSVIYLVLILGTICAQPLFLLSHSDQNVSAEEVMSGSPEAPPSTALSPADMLKMSNLWFAPFQSLVIGTMGVLFFTKRPPPPGS